MVDLDGTDVAIVSLDDLIRMKRAAGRPGDLDDIATLTKGSGSDRVTDDGAALLLTARLAQAL